MQDLCYSARYIRMSSNPTRGFLIKFFPHLLFGDVYFHVLFIFCVLLVCFDFLCVIFLLLLYCIVFF